MISCNQLGTWKCCEDIWEDLNIISSPSLFLWLRFRPGLSSRARRSKPAWQHWRQRERKSRGSWTGSPQRRKPSASETKSLWLRPQSRTRNGSSSTQYDFSCFDDLSLYLRYHLTSHAWPHPGDCLQFTYAGMIAIWPSLLGVVCENLLCELCDCSVHQLCLMAVGVRLVAGFLSLWWPLSQNLPVSLQKMFSGGLLALVGWYSH